AQLPAPRAAGEERREVVGLFLAVLVGRPGGGDGVPVLVAWLEGLVTRILGGLVTRLLGGLVTRLLGGVGVGSHAGVRLGRRGDRAALGVAVRADRADRSARPGSWVTGGRHWLGAALRFGLAAVLGRLDGRGRDGGLRRGGARLGLGRRGLRGGDLGRDLGRGAVRGLRLGRGAARGLGLTEYGAGRLRLFQGGLLRLQLGQGGVLRLRLGRDGVLHPRSHHRRRRHAPPQPQA